MAVISFAFHLSKSNAADLVQGSCINNLEDIALFLPSNDSGAEAAIRNHGPAIEAELQLARKDAVGVVDDAKCDSILRRYLKAWRPGHLSLGPWPWSMAANLSNQGKQSNGAEPFVAKIKVLSKKTILLIFPTFYDSYASNIETLLVKNRPVLETHPNWIVDVRRNNGGSDSTYQPLLIWLGSGEYVTQNVEWLSTPENLHAQESICSVAEQHASCDAFITPVIAALRYTPIGQYTLAKGESAISYDLFPGPKKIHRPGHVSVLIDRSCGSSCEQFLLAVRESQSVKLLGRPTSGELDVSNLRPHILPSGNRAIFYATSRSLRLPDMPIDQIGIQPDILLPRPLDITAENNEISRVQRWMEGGTLR